MKILKFPTTPNTLDSRLHIEATDEAKPHHHYQIYGKTQQASQKLCDIRFQNGGFSPAGDPNGISIESLLRVCENRLNEFQEGEFACPENENALRHIQEALLWLDARTQDRAMRNVEGQLKR